MQGSITNDQIDFVETWENVAPGINYIVRLNSRGDEVPEPVEGRREFKIRSVERILTEDKVLDPANDPFKNGAFRPVLVPDDINIDSNPNALSDDDIFALFKASDIAWQEYMKVVDAPATLHRMIDLADQHVDQIDLSMKRYRQLQDRLNQVTGGPKHAVQKDEETFRKMGGDA